MCQYLNALFVKAFSATVQGRRFRLDILPVDNESCGNIQKMPFKPKRERENEREREELDIELASVSIFQNVLMYLYILKQ